MNEPRILSSRGRRLSVAAIVASLELAVVTVWVTPALASCNPGRAHDNVARYAITTMSVSSLTGVSATILEYDPYYSGMNDTGTNATVMLVKRNPTQWAQLGWWKSQIQTPGTTKRQVGLEFYVSSSDNRFMFWSGQPVGSANGYKILFDAPDFYAFYLNSSHLISEGRFGAPTEYQMFGETHDYGDQMPGPVNVHEKFSYARYYTGANYTSHTMTSPISATSTWFGTSTNGQGTYEIWDKKCAN